MSDNESESKKRSVAAEDGAQDKRAKREDSYVYVAWRRSQQEGSESESIIGIYRTEHGALMGLAKHRVETGEGDEDYHSDSGSDKENAVEKTNDEYAAAYLKASFDLMKDKWLDGEEYAKDLDDCEHVYIVERVRLLDE